MFQKSGQAFSESAMQTLVLRSHGDPVLTRDFVETHRRLDYAPVEGQEDVQHLVEIAASHDQTVCFARSRSIPFDHLIHPLNLHTDNEMDEETEIEKTDGLHKCRVVLVIA